MKRKKDVIHFFGLSLGNYLEYKRISQRKISADCKISYQRVSKILNGKCNIFIDDVITVLSYLNVSLEFIVEEKWRIK
jgi:predicted XRE-type DNA-binding protein